MSHHRPQVPVYSVFCLLLWFHLLSHTPSHPAPRCVGSQPHVSLPVPRSSQVLSCLGNYICCSLDPWRSFPGCFLCWFFESHPESCFLMEVSLATMTKVISHTPLPIHTCSAHHNLSQHAIYFLQHEETKVVIPWYLFISPTGL